MHLNYAIKPSGSKEPTSDHESLPKRYYASPCKNRIYIMLYTI
jgi:hypothetical protein